MNENPLSLASDIVDKARRLGADEVDAYVVSSTESSVQVRRGATERVVEAGDNAVGIRVIKDKRTAICSTSDMTPRALDQLVRDAVELATISEPDEYAGLPERDDLAFNVNPSLQMYDEAIESLTTDEMRELALRMEAAMFDHDKRVTNSDGAEMSVTRAQVALANSLGFGGSYVGTAAALSIEAICDDAEGKKRNDYWYTAERALHRLESPEDVGRKAAQRAVAKIGARKVGTTAVPVDLGSDGGARPAAHHRRSRVGRGVVPPLDLPGRARGAAGRLRAALDHRRPAAAGTPRLEAFRRRRRDLTQPTDLRGGCVPQLPLRHVQRAARRAAQHRRRTSRYRLGAGTRQQQLRHGGR